MEQKESNLHVIQRQFGYNNVLWEVENYFSATCRKYWIIHSPEFSVSSSLVTKWRLSLEGKCIKGHRTMHTYLERLETDSFPDVVQVKWVLSYPSGEQEHEKPEMAAVFDKKTAIKTEVFGFDLLESHMRSTSCHTFKVRCRMIVYSKHRIRHEIDDGGLKSLSQDMAVLCKLGKESDVPMFVGRTVGSHKYILSVRNRVFKSAIEKKGCIELDFGWAKHKTVEDLIAFLYTGNLEYVLRIPSISMHELIKYLKVIELKSYYTEDELLIRSTIGMREFSIKWTIPDISSNGNYFVKSRCWSLGTLRTSFQLTIFLKEFGVEQEHLAICGQFSDGERLKEIFLECGILDVNDRLCEMKYLRWTCEESERLGFEKFIPKSTLDNSTLVVDGKLKIFCKLQIPSGTRRHLVINSKIQSLVCTLKQPHLEKLTADMKRLFEMAYYSDLTVKSRLVCYKVHKGVLSCRSHVFAEIISNNVEETCISFPDVDSLTLRIVLEYMYTGTLKNYDLEKIKKIYAAAEKFSILSLKHACSKILQDSIMLQNVFDILTIASKSKDFKLKYLTFKFICDNVEEVQRHENWTTFVSENPLVCKELSRFMRNIVAARQNNGTA